MNTFQEQSNFAEDALKKVKYLLKLINNNKWDDSEQNQGRYKFNTNLPLVQKMAL